MDNETLAGLLPWSSRYKGVDCDEGWTELIYQLHQDLEALYPDYTVVQVKEKFGGLRYYTEGVPYTEPLVHEEGCPEVKNDWGTYECTISGSCRRKETPGARLISEAEAKSFQTCEICGTTENVTTEGAGWIKSLCPEHHADADERRAARWAGLGKDKDDA